jgi:hypothetical protein
MGARWLTTMLLLGGCDLVFGLNGRTEPRMDANVVDDGAVDTTLDVADAPQCPVNYSALANTPPTSRYKIIVESGRAWPYALDECRNDTPGSGITHLVVFDDTVERDAVQDALPQGGTFRAWVGYARDITGQPLQFRSVTNVPLSMTSSLWRANEPDNGSGGPQETVVWFDNATQGIVDARTTDTLDGYVCECDFAPTIGFEFDVD